MEGAVPLSLQNRFFVLQIYPLTISKSCHTPHWLGIKTHTILAVLDRRYLHALVF